jgi:hypothetical protein
MKKFLLIVTLMISGCGSQGVSVTPATGLVLYEGEPVSGAVVSFVSALESGGRGASAITEEDGTFVLMTQGAEQNGAVPGEYAVLITKMVAVDDAGREIVPKAAAAYNPSVQAPEEKQPKMKNMLPKKYARKETSGLTITVERRGKNHFKLELND